MRYLFILFLLFSESSFSKSFNGFDLSNSVIAKKHIVQGGPPRDGIPAITNPAYLPAGAATFMRASDVVLGLQIDGTAYAYPRHILNWHEIVNGQADDLNFVVTYCPLCGSGMAFSSTVKNKRLSFGVSGLLYNSDLLFYDHQTESLWSQLERRAISGSYVGTELSQLPLQHTSWQAWLKKHPDTKVLSEEQGIKRNYRHDPYTGYETSSQLFFKTLRDAPSEFHSKEKVLGLVIGKKSKAYPFSELRKNGVSLFADELAGIEYEVLWDNEANSASLNSLDSEPLTPTVAFWFAWYNFHPDTQVFRANQ